MDFKDFHSTKCHPAGIQIINIKGTSKNTDFEAGVQVKSGVY